MPIFKWLTGQGKGSGSDTTPTAPLTNSHGSHRIDSSVVMRSHGGISPINPGNFSTVRSLAMLPNPQYFSPEEAEQLSEMARGKRKGAVAARKAYKSLASIEESDALVHVSHRAYEGVSAASEVKKKQADTQLARQLHSQRATYARASYSLGLAGEQAQLRIEAAQRQMDDQFAQMAQKLQGVK